MPGMWAPLAISQDTSAYLLFGSGSARAAGAGAGGPTRLGSMRHPRSVPWARNSWARWPARSLLPWPPVTRAEAGFPSSALAVAGASSPCTCSSRSLRLRRATRAASSFSLSDISTAPLHRAPRQRRAQPSKMKER
uniref:Uncharacterized protein n=1 Tax=Arundo donax TaxID=35708 RepID=A0A0A9G2H8_ARUDO